MIRNKKTTTIKNSISQYTPFICGTGTLLSCVSIRRLVLDEDALDAIAVTVTFSASMRPERKVAKRSCIEKQKKHFTYAYEYFLFKISFVYILPNSY